MSIQHIVSAKSTEKKQKQLYHSVKMVPALKSTIENCKKLFPQKKKNQFPVKISCPMVMNNKLLLKSSKDHIKKVPSKEEMRGTENRDVIPWSLFTDHAFTGVLLYSLFAGLIKSYW